MKIALLGYGKMGKEIEKIAIKNKDEIVLKVNSSNANTFTIDELKKADVAIEFSKPNTVISNIEKCFEAQIPIVVGTTAWHEQFENIKQKCIEKNATLFYASNFSVGVNLFFKINAYLAELMNNYTDYEIELDEIHHIHKLDKPSGTAITLVNQILERVERKKKWSLTEFNNEVIKINDIREGEVPGTHIIKYKSPIDDIEIMHKAHNRQGFAKGALLAAHFIASKKGIYTMSDLI